MMKKIIIIGVLVVLSLFVITLTQPSEYSVRESKSISVSKEVLMPLLTDLKKWREWSPWLEKDPEMLTNYSEPSSGMGSSVVWKSKIQGDGKQTITDIVDSEFIKMKLEFYRPHKGVAYTFFKLKEVSETETEVVWLFENKNKTVFEKFFYLVLGVKSTIQNDYQKGLSNLKKLAEAS